MAKKQKKVDKVWIELSSYQRSEISTLMIGTSEDSKSAFIYTISGGLAELIDCMNKVVITNQSIETQHIVIDKLSDRDIKLLNNHHVDTRMCHFCKKGNPIYHIQTNKTERGGDKLFLCKKHLEQLAQYLDNLLNNGHQTLTLNYKFETTTFEDVNE